MENSSFNKHLDSKIYFGSLFQNHFYNIQLELKYSLVLLVLLSMVSYVSKHFGFTFPPSLCKEMESTKLYVSLIFPIISLSMVSRIMMIETKGFDTTERTNGNARPYKYIISSHIKTNIQTFLNIIP